MKSTDPLPYEKLTEAIYFRICRTQHVLSEPYFGTFAVYRFDAPDKSFGTLYCADLFKTCFCETVLRDNPDLRVKKTDYDNRSLSLLVVDVNALNLVSLHGDAARALGFDHADLLGKDYSITQQIAYDIYNHPSEPHGIVYQSRFNSPRLAMVLFDRARLHVSTLQGFKSQPLNAVPELAEAVRATLGYTFV